jgi:hypothetical protein
MAKFKTGDTVYHTERHDFWEVVNPDPKFISDIPFNEKAIVGRKANIIRPTTYDNVYLRLNCLTLVSPDTPQNRLAIQLKYS